MYVLHFGLVPIFLVVGSSSDVEGLRFVILERFGLTMRFQAFDSEMLCKALK
ncbi:hypothetical protein D3C74_00100 [compost metagenome]